jgi:hypothetical protein
MDAIREQIASQLDSHEAHAGFDKVVEGLPAELRGVKPKGAPHSAWELLEHIRIAQWDMLEFSRNPKHTSPEFPKGYWPPAANPPDEAAWAHSVAQIKSDRQAFQDLVRDPRRDLLAKFRGAPDKPCCARPWWPPITWLITWANWYFYEESWGRGVSTASLDQEFEQPFTPICVAGRL